MRTETDLIEAIEKNDSSAVEAILRSGVPSNPRRSWWTRLLRRRVVTPLERATEIGSLPIVSLLLEHGARINDFGSSGFTPLAIAARKGYIEVVRVLLEFKAEVSRGRRGLTPICLASYYGMAEVVSCLLEYGADPNEALQGGDTSLIRIRGDILRQLRDAGGRLPKKIEELLREEEGLL